MNKVFQRLISCILASVLSFAFICANPIISHAEDGANLYSCDQYVWGKVTSAPNTYNLIRSGFSEYGTYDIKIIDGELSSSNTFIKLICTDSTHTELVQIKPRVTTNNSGDARVYVDFDFILNGIHYVGKDIELQFNSGETWYELILNAADYIVPDEEEEVARCLMYRLYNPNSGEHFYTGSLEELENLKNEGWIHEGNGFEVPVLSDTPVYRLYNPNAGDHHYTASAEEKDNLVNAGWNFEGIAWYSAPIDCNPLYRLNNPNASSGAHHYTMSEEERDNLINAGWNLEGIGWFGY